MHVLSCIVWAHGNDLSNCLNKLSLTINFRFLELLRHQLVECYKKYIY